MRLLLWGLAFLSFTFPVISAEVIPIPRAKPKDLLAGATETVLAWPNANGGWSSASVAAEREQCRVLLAGRDITFATQAPIGSDSGCGAAAPIEVTAVAGVTLDPPAIVTCRLAAGLSDWIIGTVQPAAARDLRTRVTAIATASSYACRLRNNQKSGKLSEHGKANALDMAGFSFAGSKDVTVADGWGGLLQKIGLSSGGGFLKDIRDGACRHFTTVLGPGSDAYHGNHFHVDAMARKNDWRLCQ